MTWGVNLPETVCFIPSASNEKAAPLNFYMLCRVGNLCVPSSSYSRIEPKFHTTMGSNSSSKISFLVKHSGAWCLGLHKYSRVTPLACS